jgi:hypothetical protein
MKIIIQNPVQIKNLIALVITKRIKAFINDINISFDFSAVLSETNLRLIVSKNLKNPNFSFTNTNGEIVFSYNVEEHTITEYLDNDLEDVIQLSFNEGFTKLEDHELESAERALLTLSEEDMSNGFMSEDVKRVSANNKELSFAVFGY